MNKILVIGSIVITVLIIIGIAAQFSGGISIRAYNTVNDIPTITITEPVIRGVPVTVTVASSTALPAATIEWRTVHGVVPIGVLSPATTVGLITIPCTTNDAGSVVIRNTDSGQVLTQKEITVLPPGADCLSQNTK